MVTGYEVKAYHDLARIAAALEKIAVAITLAAPAFKALAEAMADREQLGDELTKEELALERDKKGWAREGDN